MRSDRVTTLNLQRWITLFLLATGSALLGLTLAWTSFGQQFDKYAYDFLFRLETPKPWRPESIILAIDEQTLARYGYPAGLRAALADGLEKIASQHPAAVAIDLILAEPSDPASDERLENAFANTPNLVLSSDLLLDGTGWEKPLPRFRKHAVSVGQVHAALDTYDAVSRELPLEKIAGHERLWALSLATFSAGSKQPVIESPDDLAVGAVRIPSRLRDERLMRIRYLPPSMHGIPRVSISQLDRDPGLARNFAGRAVFAGVTAQTAVQDRWMTPYSSSIFMPGVEIHANAFETIARQMFLVDASPAAVVALCLTLALMAALVFAFTADWQANVLALLLIAVSQLFPALAFANSTVWPWTAGTLTTLLAVASAAAWRHLIVRRELLQSEHEKIRYQHAVQFVTHEMRTPLTAIQGSSELISRYAAMPEAKRTQIADLINAESRRLARMIETFLSVERLSAGEMELKRERFPLTALVNACLARAQPVAERKDIRIRVDPLPPGDLTGDRELMEYALYNLLTNAVKYSPPNTDVRVFGQNEKGNLVRVSVEDQGIGMDKKELSQIFEKFYRTKRAEQSGEAGTGIGLSIVEQIIVQHGGTIQVDSEPGERVAFHTGSEARGRISRFMSDSILLVEDDTSVRTTIVTFLEMEGYEVEAVSNTRDALDRLSNTAYSLVISDIYIDDRTGLDVLMAAKKHDQKSSVILMTARGTMETVMAATRNGVFDYLAKPFELNTLLEAVKRACDARQPGDDDLEAEELPESEMIGSSGRMVDIYKTVSKVAPTDATVIIEGETGTGKELIARMIHRFSNRALHPFVAVDCGAIPAPLLESELFGAMKGAFTGADRDRTGVFESANRGTVFLDEIGDIDQAFQVKLLRFLQEREIRPVGAAREKKVDVRVVAATNRDLQKMVEDGKFREDLWFRLNVVRLELPPLRERRVDVPLLAHFFLDKYNGRYGRNVRLTESGLRALRDFTWPGNVRQLQHLMERFTILAPNDRIDAEAVHDAIAAMEPKEGGGETLAETEADQIRRVLAATGGNKSRAAAVLGIERKTLYRKLERMKV